MRSKIPGEKPVSEGRGMGGSPGGPRNTLMLPDIPPKKFPILV
jgi:hypothetical protein